MNTEVIDKACRLVGATPDVFRRTAEGTYVMFGGKASAMRGSVYCVLAAGVIHGVPAMTTEDISATTGCVPAHIRVGIQQVAGGPTPQHLEKWLRGFGKEWA